MSAASYSRPSSPSASRARAARSAGRSGARFVAGSVAEDWYAQPAGPSIAVVPGAGRAPRTDEGLSAAALTLAKTCAVVCLVIALVAMARVGITAAAASCALETRELQTSIELARAEGSDLEISQSVLSNPSRIKTQAQALGMAVPSEANSDQIVLPPDIVATDEAGRLSLSETMARLSES
ncbi:cell division protein FtsL [uncultured Adlercreutzia sp.]|uniref:cell division protein FtsL n=1 Tax=uncultured Adlercreutzia sp. TaxID=875803 RepID=UPI0025CFE579|nr:cell division protein FtsL [uncultured Adlercreutzia sp.]